MEQAGCAAGEQAKRSRRRAPGEIRAFAGAAPGCPASSAGARAASGLRPEATPSCQELADRRKCRKARPDAVRKTPQQSVERRAGGRIPPVISGDPEMDPAARRVIGCGVSAPAPVGALLPLIFWGAETDKGCPLPSRSGRRSFGRLTPPTLR